MVQAVRAHLLLVGPQEQAVPCSLLGWLQVLRERMGSSLLLVLDDLTTDLGCSCCLIAVPSTFRSGIQTPCPGDISSPSTILCLWS